MTYSFIIHKTQDYKDKGELLTPDDICICAPDLQTAVNQLPSYIKDLE